MAVQSPPFALQNASHSAQVFRQAAYSPWAASGVMAPADFAVTAQGTPNMSVAVAAGRAWIPGSQVANVTGGTFSTQAGYFAINDAPVTVTISTANATNPRIDVIYVAVQDAFYSGSNNQTVLGVVTGTPAATPGVPSAPSNALVLAQVAVAANATSITNSNITQTPAGSLLASTLGGIDPVISTNVTAGTYLGQYRDHPTLGLQRWNGANWLTLGFGAVPGWTTVNLNSPLTQGTLGSAYQIRNGMCTVVIDASYSGTYAASFALNTTTVPLPAHAFYAPGNFYGTLSAAMLEVTTGGLVVNQVAATAGGITTTFTYPVG